MICDSLKLTQAIFNQRSKIKSKLAKESETARNLKIKAWKVSMGPVHSNILWGNYFDTSFITTLKSALLNLLIIVLAVTFISPVYFMEFFERTGVSEQISQVANNSPKFISDQLYGLLAPFALIVANYILIP